MVQSQVMAEYSMIVSSSHFVYKEFGFVQFKQVNC